MSTVDEMSGVPEAQTSMGNAQAEKTSRASLGQIRKGLAPFPFPTHSMEAVSLR